MDRDELLKKAGFSNSFIENLNVYEKENPIVVHERYSYSDYSKKSFYDSMKSVITVAKPVSRNIIHL